jgi:hypothetical protein
MATTKEKVRAKVIGLLDDIRPHLEQKLEKLLDSGTINFEEEDDNYALPKDIVQALVREMEFQYSRHLMGRHKKTIERYFQIM